MEDEIHFFKVERPKILALLFYHNCIYKLETFKPKNGKKEIKEYLMSQKDELKLFAFKHQEFYKYHQSGSTRFDPIYFVRGKCDIKTCITSMYLMVDERFCTFHCFLTAKILANQRFNDYVDESLLRLKTFSNISFANKTDLTHFHKLNWTASRISFVELVYALHEDKAINDGDLTLTQMMELFGSILNIKAGHFSGSYFEMKLRTNSKTRYLDSLVNKMVKRMNKDDD